ncbi:MAG TPA: DUF1028 domain-containing protein [Chryseolinea sp.]|nr:DUF1028 domain-containing protein [Chryseolinea sp.]
MKKYVIALIVLLSSSLQSFATWSIIIIDPKTKEIGIAGASCTYNCDGIGKILPNLGAVIVQAMSNNQAREKGTQMILAESTPEEIIQAMRDPIFDPERQQYAVITIKYINDPKTYTGNLTHSVNGALTTYGVSVQGNTLASDTQLEAIMDVVKEGQTGSLHIAEILMNALHAGSESGGDKRCGEQRATSAFLTVAKPNDRKPYLHLVIFGQGKGKSNAVHLLRIKYEKWKRKHDVD